MDKQKDFEKGWEEYKVKRKQEIEELESAIYDNYSDDTKFMATALYNAGYRKIPKNAVVLTREEYNELVNLQQTHSEELTNAIQSYEEGKADLKINYDNHIKNLEKIIDRQSKDLNSQANRLIGLKAKLENARKETAEKFARLVEFHSVSTRDNDGVEIFTISALGLKEILHEEFGIPYDEICKEITEEKKTNERL